MIAFSEEILTQKTVKSPINFKGVGLHSGKSSDLLIKPSQPNSGINFIRTDVSSNNSVKALWSNVVSTTLSTNISNQHGITISTVEHLMSALSGMHIDNVDILINGP